MLCDHPLSGNILQLNIVMPHSRPCISNESNTCKDQFLKDLKNIFNRKLIIPITIQFDPNYSKKINIRMCSLTEMTGKNT